MVLCSVRVLGRFEVSVDGRVVPVDAWRSRRASDLVKVLALESSHTLHREQVLDLLWPDLGVEAAGANLRKAIHYARRALGAEDAIRSESGMVSLYGGRVDVDATRFVAAADAALASGNQEQFAVAAQMYAGEPIPADRYEHWATEPRDRLRRRYIAVLKGAGLWERVIQLDPTDEESHRALMSAYFDSGRRREAIRQFEWLRDALREFIGVGPDPTTIALYEQILALDGPHPPEAAHRAAALVATGLVHLNRHEFADAERLAREARELAIDTELAHETGDASTLLALVSSLTGRWHEVFRHEFTASLTQDVRLSRATYDANLCFAEYQVAGATSPSDAQTYALELLALAEAAESDPGRGLAQLMLGEAMLISGQADRARELLRRACDTSAQTGTTGVMCISLERLAQTEIALDHRHRVAALITRAHSAASSSPIRSHLLVRILGVEVQAATDPVTAMITVTEAEQKLSDATCVCEPCSMNFRVQATSACARAGELTRARRHLADAERVASLWQGGPTSAAVWEARAAIRHGEGHSRQAVALLHEAAAEYAHTQRPADQERCQKAAQLLA